MPEVTHPEDFDSIFSKEVLIVGGHAVNLWASFYAPRGDEALKRFLPFTSKDADIYLKNREHAATLAASVGWRFIPNPETRSPMMGVITMTRDGVELQVDVLRAVAGLTDEDLSETTSIVFENGKRYSLPTPIVMLKAKLSNLGAFDQEKRQDERHIRMLILCCAHYLSDTCDAVRASELPEREAVETFMQAHRIITSKPARELDKKHGLSLDEAIPKIKKLGDLNGLPRIKAYYLNQRVSEWGRGMNG